MGDRANVVIDEQDGGTIYLYTHWGGSELPETLQNALKRKWRWDDESYLTRIIFQEMTGPELRETGFGIATSPPDNSYPYLRVSTAKHTITVDYDPVREYHDHPNLVLSFEQYIGLGEIGWNNLEALADLAKTEKQTGG